MKNLYKVSLLLLLITSSGFNAMSQTKLKFGHINSRKVMMEMPEYKAAEALIQAETAKMEKQLTDMKEAFQKQVEVYQKTANTLSNADRSQKEAELAERSQKVQAFIGTAQQILDKKSKDLQEPVSAKLAGAVEDVGMEGGFLYIFEVEPGLPVYHSAQSVDVALLVKAKLEAKAIKTLPASAPTTSKK